MAIINVEHLVYIKPINWWCNLLSFLGVLLLTIDFVRRSRIGKAAKMNRLISGTAYCMFISSTLSLTCKVSMPYLVNCRWGQRITVFFYTIIRCSYYLYLCYRLELAFGDSMVTPVNKKAMRVFRWWVTVTSIFIGTWNIYGVRTIEQLNVTPWGLYCELYTPQANVLFYAAFDFFVSGSMVYLFVSKLYKVTKWFNANRTGDNVVENKKVLDKIRLLTGLAVMSIVSTWIFVIGGHTVIPALNWTVTADYFINVICLYLMFGFVKLRERLSIAEDIGCPGSKYFCWCWCCIPFTFVCWKEETRTMMSKLELSRTATFARSKTGSKDNTKEPESTKVSSATSIDKTVVSSGSEEDKV